MEEYVCIKCWRMIQARKAETSRRSCGSCGSRVVRNFKDLCTAVAKLKETYGSPEGTPMQGGHVAMAEFFEENPNLLEAAPLLKELYRDIPMKDGIDAFIKIDTWANRFPGGSIEDFMILQIRKITRASTTAAAATASGDGGTGITPGPSNRFMSVTESKKLDALPTEKVVKDHVPRRSLVLVKPSGERLRLNNPSKSLTATLKKHGVKPDHAWTCPDCKHPNPGKTKECRNCHQPRPSAAEQKKFDEKMARRKVSEAKKTKKITRRRD
jgi:DNA-directed RNA polymerase subunit RPC12/RpoP